MQGPSFCHVKSEGSAVGTSILELRPHLLVGHVHTCQLAPHAGSILLIKVSNDSCSSFNNDVDKLASRISPVQSVQSSLV